VPRDSLISVVWHRASATTVKLTTAERTSSAFLFYCLIASSEVAMRFRGAQEGPATMGDLNLLAAPTVEAYLHCGEASTPAG
jgi:hypothetical protein